MEVTSPRRLTARQKAEVVLALLRGELLSDPHGTCGAAGRYQTLKRLRADTAEKGQEGEKRQISARKGHKPQLHEIPVL